MAKINIEELVSVYNKVTAHDNKENSLNVMVYRNKDDFVKKYVEKNLLNMKIDEPIHGERYDDTFKDYMDKINMILSAYDEDELIIVGVFDKYPENWSIGESDIRVYDIDNIDFLMEDVSEYYK